jgi:ankyrin repeat protein
MGSPSRRLHAQARGGGHLGQVKLLLERGADVNARDEETDTALLIVTSQERHSQVVDMLL